MLIYIRCGKVDGVFATIYAGPRTDPRIAFQKQRERQEYGPLVNSEYYPGWINKWGLPYQKEDDKQFKDTLDVKLSLNASVIMLAILYYIIY